MAHTRILKPIQNLNPKLVSISVWDKRNDRNMVAVSTRNKDVDDFSNLITVLIPYSGYINAGLIACLQKGSRGIDDVRAAKCKQLLHLIDNDCKVNKSI